MRNVLRERFDALPESQQHLIKAVGAGGLSAASFAYTAFAGRPRRDERGENIISPDGTQILFGIGSAAMWGNTASEEFKAFQEARQTEAQ